MTEVRIALVGYRGIGKMHSLGLRSVRSFFDLGVVPVQALLCGRDADATRRAAERFGWEGFAADWREAVERPDIDLVDICTPNDLHAPIAIAAARAGKHVVCEKPLATSLPEAVAMLAQAQRSHVHHMTAFTFRCVPALRLARELVAEGRIGKVRQLRASWLSDLLDPALPLSWFFRKSSAGYGACGDLGSHIIDLAHFLIGSIEEVVAEVGTFTLLRPLATGAVVSGSPVSVRPADNAPGAPAAGSTGQAQREPAGPAERVPAGGAPVAPDMPIGSSPGGAPETDLYAPDGPQGALGAVDVDDAALFLARFSNGAIGSFEASRSAGGHREEFDIEIHGSRGTIGFNSNSFNSLRFYDAADDARVRGARTIFVGNVTHPYGESVCPYGEVIGRSDLFVIQAYELLDALARDVDPAPSFIDGVRCQAVLDAVIESARVHAWVRPDYTAIEPAPRGPA